MTTRKAKTKANTGVLRCAQDDKLKGNGKGRHDGNVKRRQER
jgi:hypothetical protein